MSDSKFQAIVLPQIRIIYKEYKYKDNLNVECFGQYIYSKLATIKKDGKVYAIEFKVGNEREAITSLLKKMKKLA